MNTQNLQRIYWSALSMTFVSTLTHFPLVPYICVSKLRQHCLTNELVCRLFGAEPLPESTHVCEMVSILPRGRWVLISVINAFGQTYPIGYLADADIDTFSTTQQFYQSFVESSLCGTYCFDKNLVLPLGHTSTFRFAWTDWLPFRR